MGPDGNRGRVLVRCGGASQMGEEASTRLSALFTRYAPLVLSRHSEEGGGRGEEGEAEVQGAVCGCEPSRLRSLRHPSPVCTKGRRTACGNPFIRETIGSLRYLVTRECPPISIRVLRVREVEDFG